MKLSTLKQAIKESDKETVREVLDTYDEEVLEAAVDLGISPADVAEAYQGEFKSDRDFAEDFADQLGVVDKNATWPNNCIDWDYVAKELMYDYCESNGHYFRNL